MTYQLWYRTGTVTLTNGSTAVTGTLTAWLADIRPGDAITVDGTRWVEIAAVNSNTLLTLATAWGGATYAGAYAIDRRSLTRQVGSDTGARVAAFLAQLKLVPSLVSGNALKILRANADSTAYELVELTKSLVGLGSVDNTSDANKPLSLAAQNPFGMAAAAANVLVNGSMTVSQENGASAVTANGAYPVDQWAATISGNTLTASFQQVTDAPPGFTNSLRVTVTGADTSDAILGFMQPIEGARLAPFALGTANAKSGMLQFWAKSSVAGAVGWVEFVDSTMTPRHNAGFSISAANTWEYKTIAMTAMTTGTWPTGSTKGGGIRIQCGNTFAGVTGILGSASATFQIGGVSLLPGAQALLSDVSWMAQRPYSDELMLCQRYFERLPDNNTQALSGIAVGQLTTSTTTRIILTYAVEKRAVPTLAPPVNIVIGASGFTQTATAIANGFPGRKYAMIDYAHAAHGSPVGVVAILYAGNTGARQDVNARM